MNINANQKNIPFFETENFLVTYDKDFQKEVTIDGKTKTVTVVRNFCIDCWIILVDLYTHLNTFYVVLQS